MTIIICIGMLFFTGISEAQWSFNGTHIYNTNSGNVGIGIMTPGYLLHVSKNMVSPSIRIQNAGGTGGAAFEMIDNISGADWKFKATNSGGFKIRDHANGLDVVTIEPNSKANVIYIKTGGNVGIGTAAALYKLDVQDLAPFIRVKSSAGYTGIIIDKSTSIANGYVVHRQGGTTLWTEGTIGNDNFSLYNWSIGDEALNVNIANNNSKFSGRIGIKTDPGYDLHINSADYTAAYFYSPYEGGTVCDIIAGGTTAGTWALYASATTLGFAAYFNGNVYCTGSYLPSDEILKENIEPMHNALDKIMMLDVKTYTFKTDEFPEMNLPTNNQIGFTAQNMETVFPELVKLNPAKGKEQPIEFKAINYTGLIPVLTEALQEQQKEMDAKDARIDDLQKQLNDLKILVLSNQ